MVKEESEGDRCTRRVHDYAKGQSGIRHFHHRSCVVLEKYDVVFPWDVPLGLPMVHEGYELKIDMEDEVSLGSLPVVQDEPASS